MNEKMYKDRGAELKADLQYVKEVDLATLKQMPRSGEFFGEGLCLYFFLNCTWFPLLSFYIQKSETVIF